MLRVTRPGAMEQPRWTKPAEAAAAAAKAKFPLASGPMRPARPDHQPHPGLAPVATPAVRGRRPKRARVPRQRRAYRAPHALVRRASGKLPTPRPAHPRTLTARYLRPTGRHSAPPLPNPSRDGTAWRADPEPTPGTLTILAAFGEKEENPPQPCACVEGRSAPAMNETPTWAPIGWDVRPYAHACSLGKQAGGCWSVPNPRSFSLTGIAGLA